MVRGVLVITFVDKNHNCQWIILINKSILLITSIMKSWCFMSSKVSSSVYWEHLSYVSSPSLAFPRTQPTRLCHSIAVQRPPSPSTVVPVFPRRGWLIWQINSNKWIGKEKCGRKSRLTSATTKCNGKCRQLNRRFNEAPSLQGCGWSIEKVSQFIPQPLRCHPHLPHNARVEKLIFIHRLFY